MGDSAGAFAFWIAVGVGQVAFWAAVSPIIKAFADRIRARGGVDTGLDARIEALEAARPVTGESDAVYHRMSELEERLDFAERLLAQGRGETARIEEGR